MWLHEKDYFDLQEDIYRNKNGREIFAKDQKVENARRLQDYDQESIKRCENRKHNL